MIVATRREGGRTNQKARTRRAIIDACQKLTRGGRVVTMPDVARAAMVSEATAYRYFPDLASLLSEAMFDDWPSPAEALAPVASSTDPVERVVFAARVLLEGVAARQMVVRTMIAATIQRSELDGRARPGIHFGLIDEALAPFVDQLAAVDPQLPEQLRRDLTIVVSAEAFFSLTGLSGFNTDDAIGSVVDTARVLTEARFAQSGRRRRSR